MGGKIIMFKAKYIGKSVYNNWGTTVTQLEYEYRGHTYFVEERTDGNEPLRQQHQTEQDWIDHIIEDEEKAKTTEHEGPTAEESFNQFWEEYWK